MEKLVNGTGGELVGVFVEMRSKRLTVMRLGAFGCLGAVRVQYGRGGRKSTEKKTIDLKYATPL